MERYKCPEFALSGTVTRCMEVLAQTGLIARLETYIEIVDRTVLAEFAEAVRSALSQ